MRRALTALRDPRFAAARFIVVAFVCTRAAVALLDFTALRVIGPPEGTPPPAGYAVDSYAGTLVQRHGHAYERVARVGYEHTHLDARHGPTARALPREPTAPSAFDVPFPALPYLSRAFAALTGASIAAAGVVLSHTALLGALFFVFALGRRYAGDDGGRRAVLLALVFPTSLFFSVYSPEALFLFFSSGALLAYERGRLPAAGLLGAGAALTLPVGLALFPALLVGALLRGRAAGRTWSPRLAWLAAIPLATAGFAIAFHHVTGNALVFVMASAEGATALPLLTLARAAARVEWSFPAPEPAQMALAFGLVASLGLFAAAAHALRRLDAAHALFLLLALCGLLAGGSVTGVARGAAGLAPVFLVLALVTARPLVERFVLYASTLFLGLHALTFGTSAFAG